MIARIYATHKKVIDRGWGVTLRAGVSKEGSEIVETASITISDISTAMSIATEVPLAILGLDAQIGDEFEVYFERKRK